MDHTEDLSARVLLKHILTTEPPRTPITRSTSKASSVSTPVTRRSSRQANKDVGGHTLEGLLRRSLRNKIHESITRKSLPPPKRRTASVVLKRVETPAPASILLDDGDTPRHILMNILQTEPVRTPVVHDKAASEPLMPQPPSANSSIASNRLSTELSGFDLPDLTVNNVISTAAGLNRKRPRRSLNVTAFEKRLREEGGNEEQKEESMQDDSSLSSTSSTSLSLKTPFVDVNMEKRGLQRRVVNRRKITEEEFEAAVEKRHMGGASSFMQAERSLSETGYSEGFTLGLSKLGEPDITTDIIHCNTALYAKPDSTTTSYSMVATQDKPTLMASQLQRQMLELEQSEMRKDKSLYTFTTEEEAVAERQDENCLSESEKEDRREAVGKSLEEKVRAESQIDVKGDTAEEELNVLEAQIEEEGAADLQTEEVGSGINNEPEDDAANGSQAEEEEIQPDSQSQEEEENREDQEEEEESVVKSQTEDEEQEDVDSQAEEEEIQLDSQSQEEEENIKDQEEEEEEKDESAVESQTEDEEQECVDSQVEVEEIQPDTQEEEEEEEESQTGGDDIDSQTEVEEIQPDSQSQQEEEGESAVESQAEEEKEDNAAEFLSEEEEGADQEIEKNPAETGLSDSKDGHNGEEEKEDGVEQASAHLEGDVEHISRRAHRSERGPVLITEAEGDLAVARLSDSKSKAHSTFDLHNSLEMGSYDSGLPVGNTNVPDSSTHGQTSASLDGAEPDADKENSLHLEITQNNEDNKSHQEASAQEEEWEDEEDDNEETEDIPSKTPAFVRQKRSFFHPDPEASPSVLKNIQASTSKGEGSSAPKPKQVRKRKSEPTRREGLPKGYLMGIFKHFAKTKVSADVYPVLQEIMNKFFERLAEDLQTYAIHAKRKTIEVEDIELLLKRQGHVNDKVPVEVLIEKYLRMDQRRLLIPIATSRNVVIPKKR